MKDKIKKVRITYRKQLKISKYYLDDAAEEQPGLFDKWYQRYVDEYAKLELMEDDFNKKIRKAIVEGDSKFLTKHGLHSTTEKAITRAIEGHVTDQRWLVKTLEGAYKAFDQRRQSIKMLQELFISSYFGDVDSVRMREVRERISKATRVPEPKKLSSPRKARRSLE
jgi:oligoribonuclease NrnB/cAMP/cGMP phosphodiesterase (DHH superfamily)